MVRALSLDLASVLVHPFYRSTQRHRSEWRLKNTMHSVRDRFSPRYAHRQTYNEVVEWLEDVGFKIIDVQSPRAYKQFFAKQLWGVGMTGKHQADGLADRSVSHGPFRPSI